MSNKPSDLLRGLKSLSGPFPNWDTEQLPDRPGELFLEWLKLAAQKERISRDPDVVTPNWRLYAVNAKEVEFWQGDPERKHVRIQYVLQHGQWKHQRLWP